MLGDARSDDTDAAVDAALELEELAPDGMDAPLILAIAWAESRFDNRARPMCGVMQVGPRDMGEPRSRCAEWRASAWDGIMAGIREVRLIMTIRRVGGDLHRALEYRACGRKAFTRRCRKRRWLRRVEAIAARLREPPYRIEGRGP